VWASPLSVKGQPRLTLRECPVSFVSGESEAALQEFLVAMAAGTDGDFLRWPARRVDAFLTLREELLRWRMSEDGAK
jgi:hypothetical protein